MPEVFQELLKHKPLVDQYMKHASPNVSVLHFSSIALWMEHFNFTFQVIDQCLCVIANQPNAAFLVWPPLGPVTKRTCDACFAQLNDINPNTARIENIDEKSKIFYESLGYRVIKKADEYIYKKEDIIHYKGNAYKSQRHDVNHLLARHRYRTITLHEEHSDACLQIFDQWREHKEKCLSQQPIALDMLASTRRTHEIALRHMSLLELSGILIFVDETPVAYSLGYPLNQDVFVVLLEVCDVHITGLSALTFREMCQQPTWKSFSYVNVMDDFGIPNIAHTKQLYQPSFIKSVYNADQHGRKNV